MAFRSPASPCSFTSWAIFWALALWVFNPMAFTSIPPSRGGAAYREESRDPLLGFAVGSGGVLLGLLSAAIVLLVAARLQRRPQVKLALVIFSGFTLIYSFLYLTGGYYCHFGDFSDWKVSFPHLQYVMPLLVLSLPLIGWLLGGFYLPLQEGWLPAGSPAQRFRLSVLAVGIICVLFSLGAGWIRQSMWESLPAPYTFLLVFSFSMLMFAGAVPRLYDKRLFSGSAAALPLSAKTLLAPLLLSFSLCLPVFCSGGDIEFPHRKTGTSLAQAYTDKLLARNEPPFSLCGDNRGNIFWISSKGRAITALSPENKKTQTPIPGLPFRRIQVRAPFTYLLCVDGQKHQLARYDPRDRQVTPLLDGLSEDTKFDVAPTGHLYFSDGNDTLLLLPRDAKQAKRLWIAPERISDIAASAAGVIYISLSHGGFGETGRIYVLKDGAAKPQLIAAHLSNPRTLEVDAQENIYVAGMGWSSIYMIPATNRNARFLLRGPWNVRDIALSQDGDIYYWPCDKNWGDFHVLRPKTAR